MLMLEYMLLSNPVSGLSSQSSVNTGDVTTTNVASALQFTIPDGKLFYPEPFIASPSYLHSDITFLHIFQYWYWLWFMFIFLICFFFISFLCTVRWCNNRVRPRRETRGVSRSKCGDLITACVPVSWAMSIIVNESTDATDLNDGFGSAELVVGVRAYQWGWEYYYPKTIDLNYNVRPSYSTFVGNSLKYNSTSGKTLASNTMWRMYQNKTEDRVITPAHLMLVPMDSGKMLNFMNFKSIGLNTLQESSAFAKIRNSSKVYNSHLVHTPSTFTGKYSTINSLYVDENTLLTSSSFGVRRQHNLASASSLGNTFASTMLDNASFEKFLESNFSRNASMTSTVPMSQIAALSLHHSSSVGPSSDTSRLATLLLDTKSSNASPLGLLLSYPAALTALNDNSDKAGLSYTATKLSSKNISNAVLNNADLQGLTNDVTSRHSSYVSENVTNENVNPRVFNLSGPNSKVLLGDQSIRNLPDVTPSKSNLNLSESTNPVASVLGLADATNQNLSPYSGVVQSRTDFVDTSLVNNIASSRSFTALPHPAVQSSLPTGAQSLEYDSSTARTEARSFSSKGEFVVQHKSKRGPVGDVFVGSREKTPKSINTAYWSTFWSSTNPNSRLSSALAANWNRTSFYLPTFYGYSDYDFRNDQAIDMLEELLWENSYSAYNFYDYMTLSKELSSGTSFSSKDFGMQKQFLTLTLGIDAPAQVLSAAPLKDLSIIGSTYGSGVQMEDYVANPLSLQTQNFGLLPIYSDLVELDESYTSFKGISSLLDKFSVSAIAGSNAGVSTRSYLSVFNFFRSDFEDFNWSRTLSTSADNDLNTALETVPSATRLADLTVLYTNSDVDGSALGSDVRLSNPATLRPSVRNSIVNYNAFQKVFKPRLDEGRAHVQSSSFADLGLKQPFLSDSKVPYLQLLGKNRDSFFETPLYNNTPHLNFNSASALADSLNTPMFDFPFLMARTSDTARFTWIDWFAKWKYIEVQPSSVSRYSTLGAPYFRKAYDFNSNVGDKFQDTELYFTRVARSRRNYLTNWSYSPFMYNRAYVWNAESLFDAALLNLQDSVSSAKFACSVMSWYWTSPSLTPNTSDVINYSMSGNDFYGKSTWRPRSSIESYYYNTSKLIDILSRREFLYRRYLENSNSVVHLPRTLCATPNNPLLLELKSSFLFSDPATFSSEHSRDMLYTSTSYFKFLYFKSLAQQIAGTISSAPVNHSLLTDYVFFYFFGTNTNSIGKNAELYKSQFRPLKKGISSMLRLHATGAIAMPIEIRLQVLASSRDVIHSWAIPSASIKIDCVPGYTSHRMMKFLLTGVYWGQCQEICGRYHHWMPIVVYFMKRDLFFLWCTHFVSAPSPSETWDISDRRFADFIRFASYDRSSWLSEFGTN